MIIDPPSPFSPADEWRAFLEEMKGCEPHDADDERQIAEHIDLAERTLLELNRNGGSPFPRP